MHPEEPPAAPGTPDAANDRQALEQRLNRLELQMQEVLTLLRAGAQPAGRSAPLMSPERSPAVPAPEPGPVLGGVPAEPQVPFPGVAAGPESVPGQAIRNAGALESEQWLTRFGVLLLVVGIAFVVRYTAALGWWTESARLAGSTLLGAGLVGASWWQWRTRPGWSVLVAGAGYAVLHISMVGAFRFYGLVPQVVALVGVAVVAALSVADTWRRQHDAPSVIGLAGAWLAPFVTADWGGADSAGGWFLVLYFVMSACAWWLRASDVLLMLHVLGGVSAGVVLLEQALDTAAGSTLATSTTSAATAVLLVVHLGLTLVLAPLRRAWGGPTVGASALILSPVAAVSFTCLAAGLWTGFDSRFAAGAVYGVVALVGVASHLVVRRWSLDPFEPAASSALLTAAVAAALLAPGPWQMAAVAVVIAAAQLGSRSNGGLVGAANAGSVLALLAAPTMVVVWLIPEVREVVLLPGSSPMVHLVSQVLPWLVLSGSSWWTTTEAGRPQALGAYLMAMGALWTTAAGFGSPQLVISVGWSALAVGAIVVGLAPSRSSARWTGIVTLGAVVARLLLFDLDALSPLLRIGIFSGLGVILLIAGYVVPRLARAGTGEEDPPQRGVP